LNTQCGRDQDGCDIFELLRLLCIIFKYRADNTQVLKPVLIMHKNKLIRFMI